MRMLSGIAALLLLASSENAPAAGGTGAAGNGERRPAIQHIHIENRKDTAVIVVLSRDSARAPFRRAIKLKPKATQGIDIPDLPWLLVRVLARDDVRRAAERSEKRGSGENGKRGNGLRLGLALAGGHEEDRRDNHDPEHDDRHEENNQEHDDRHSDGRNSTRDAAMGLLFGRLLGDGGDGKNRDGDSGNGLVGSSDIVDADDGSGEQRIDGVGLTVTTGDVEGVEEDDIAILAGESNIAISNDAPPVAAQPPELATDPCFCGPDVTAAYLVALKRAYDRIKALPDSETGAWDGAWFLSRNAGTMDEIARGVPIPGKQNLDEEAGANMLCPSGPCGKLPGAGSGTLSICGVCLPKHVGNDIMYGFVGTLLDVPPEIQNMGGHYAQIFSAYSSLDPPQSRAAYAIGSNIAELANTQEGGDPFKREDVCQRLNKTTMYRLSSATQPPILFDALDFIQEVYPALANCPRCPADATQPGTLLKDWTTSSWTLDDGTRVYAPGFEPKPPTDENE